MSDWISVDDEFPKNNTNVLVTYKNSLGFNQMVVGHYIKRFTIESSCENDEYDEYSEDDDEHYLCGGWYEQQDNWGEYSSIYIDEGEVTHWMPLPKPPGENNE